MARQLSASVFVVRAWWEDDAFRARITYTDPLDDENAEKTQVLTADCDDVRRHLAAWLARIGA